MFKPASLRLHAASCRAALGGRFFPVVASYALVLGIGFLTRLALAQSPDTGTLGGVWPTLRAFASGLLFDAVIATYFALPLTLWLAALPERLARSRLHRAVLIAAIGVFACVLLSIAVSEWLFWDEFGARFNFIAVDYLVYTQELLGNVRESYPVRLILGVVAGLAVILTAALARPLWRRSAQAPVRRVRPILAAGMLLAAVVTTAWVSADSRPALERDSARELAGNGVYQFFSAFRHNSLDYSRFYATLPPQQVQTLVAAQLTAAAERWPASAGDPTERLVLDDRPERPLNVVLVSIESMGAEFLGVFGNARGLTPNLDRLSAESLSFTNVFSTGNRTVRGLEALSLSIPPTPGESIVKRPGAQHLFSLGSVFEDRGYESLFLYGGYGYFDNMNAFFGANDYQTVDRTAIPKESIHFENIWGVADEHLFDLTLQQLDARHASGKRFFAHVMTTSNHRPYTYPAGRIDIASGSGRDGAVKYSDYALGRFIEAARRRPWFENTLFVLTADHGANARGTLDIPVEQYRIPLLFYAPKHIAPARVERLMSQIDIPPTILGQLRFGYRTKFFGRDMLRTKPGEERAFVATYQTLGYLRGGRLVTLAPQGHIRVRPFPKGALPTGPSDEALRDEAIALYQTAAHVYHSRLYGDSESNVEPPPAPARMTKADLAN
jgi:phosphoglycerol transferase MdoB-like AlkP superfamily enzyme